MVSTEDKVFEEERPPPLENDNQAVPWPRATASQQKLDRKKEEEKDKVRSGKRRMNR